MLPDQAPPAEAADTAGVFAIPLAEAVDDEIAGEIAKQSVYVSSRVVRMRLDAERRQVLVEHRGMADEALRAKVGRFVAAMVAGARPVEKTVLVHHARRNPAPLERNVYARLLEHGWVVELGHGQVALSGLALATAELISDRCRDLARRRFAAVERSYPTIMPTEQLARCGYISSFPQNLSMVTHLQEDYDAIEAFRRANLHGGPIAIPDAAAVSPPTACLCPALCYHCYPTLAGRHLDRNGHVETATGRICRYESSNITGLDRLWEFSQRSIIWLGTDEFCTQMRMHTIEAAREQLAEWDIEATIETANDPFFAAVTTAKSFWQRSQELKYELRAAVEPHPGEPHRTIAAASFNLHGTFFGDAFDIRDADTAPACSGCVSWGLERWVLVVFTQHGFDPGRWPPGLRP